MGDDVYDDSTWAVVDHWHAPRRRLPAEVASGWRAGVGATALMTAAALGVQDVLEPKRDDPIIEEIDLDSLRPSERAPVEYHHVRGAPKASRAIVRPWLMSVVLGLLIVSATLAATTSTAVAGTPIGPHQQFDGVVNGKTAAAIVYTVCPGPAVPGTSGPVAGNQWMAVARARSGGGNTGLFSQVYAWFVQDSSSSTPAQVTFASYGVKQVIPSTVRVPCEGTGQVQFSSCPFGAPCAAGFVPDIVDVTFVNIAD